MTGQLGSVVVAGRTLTVTGLALRSGRLIITAVLAESPAWPEVTDATAAVFGADGTAICRGWRVDIPAMPGGKNLTVELPVEITITESRRED